MCASVAGVQTGARPSYWPALVAAKDELVTSLRQKKYIDLLPEYNGVAYLEGAGRLNGQGVMVNGAAISAGKIIIATGTSPALPDIPGIEEVPYLTSTTALALRSEEHTSELQSIMRTSYAVLCSKKKKQIYHIQKPSHSKNTHHNITHRPKDQSINLPN